MVATFMIMAAESKEIWADEKSARAFSAFFLDDMKKDLPATATARISEARLESFGGTRVVRFTVDVEGLGPGLQQSLEHQELAVTFSRNLTYVVSFGGAAADAMAIKAAADETTPTTSLALDARPQPALTRWSLPLAIFIAVDIAIAIAWLRRRQLRQQARTEPRPS
jgi:hypothetical protein